MPVKKNHIAPILLALFLLVGMPPAPGAAACTEATGRTERQSYRSVIATTTMHYTVYLPPCYDDNTVSSYPTVYLMHGSAQFDDHWLQIGLDDVLDAGITSGELPPMIAVLPYGEWIANENRFEDVSFEMVFLQELLPAVESAYRVSAERDTRAIGGISRGGFWAYVIAFRHPTLFGAVGGHSAFFDPYHAPPEHNPLDLALDAEGIDDLRIWLDRGAQDFARPGLDQMDEHLRQRGVDYTYTVHAQGEHDNRYWREHVAEYLAFYAEPWQSSQPVAVPTVDPAAFTFSPPRATPTADVDLFEFTPPKAQATATPAPTEAVTNARLVFVPVVAFNSTRANLDSGAFWDLLAGAPDRDFILDTDTAALLAANGVNVPQARTIPPNELMPALWADRNKYALLPFDALHPRYRVLNIDNEHPLMSVDNYPLALPSAAPNFDPALLTTLTLSGVTAITRDSIAPIDEYGVQWVSSGIADYTTRVDFFHTSNEVSFTPLCPQFTEQPLGAFCSKDAHFDILTRVGVDVVELSGNHNNDYGYDNYRRTLQMYQQAGIQTLGGGETPQEAQQPLLLEHNGSTIAMIACNDAGPYYALASDDRPGAADCKGGWLREALGTLRPNVDVIVVTVQHIEYEEYLPRTEIQLDFRQIADWGADVVAGTHAHKPQSFEFYGTARGSTAVIHYGLGNLFFDQPFWGNSRFWMDTLYIYDGRLVTVDLFTGIIDEQARPRRMTAEEQKNFLEFMFLVNNGVQ